MQRGGDESRYEADTEDCSLRSGSKACWDADYREGVHACVRLCVCMFVFREVPTFFMRMLRLSEAFLTNGDFLERVELSLSLRFICKDQVLNQTVAFLVPRSTSFCYPADVLALRAGGERLGADDGVPPHEGVLLADIRTALFGSNYRAALGWQGADHARLLVDLERENVVKYDGEQKFEVKKR